MRKAIKFRERLDAAFCEETCAPGAWDPRCPSRGHCAVASLLFAYAHGGELMSAAVDGVSHWINHADGRFIDLTADQHSSTDITITIQPPRRGLRRRRLSEVRAETWARAAILASRMHAEEDTP